MPNGTVMSKKIITSVKTTINQHNKMKTRSGRIDLSPIVIQNISCKQIQIKIPIIKIT